MKQMPWVRFFASDWLAGTRGMSAVETGVYITLVATMYERGEPLVEDHARLSRLCGASNSAFKKALETLIEEGKIIRVEAGLWNERVEKEQVYLSEKSEVGRKAANIRHSKKDKENNGGDDANAMPAHSEGNANQKPEYSSLRSERARASSDDVSFNEFWEAFPNKIGMPKAKVAYFAAIQNSSPADVLEGAKRYALKTDDRQWCNPVRWLSEERWKDQPAAPPDRPVRAIAEITHLNRFQTREQYIAAELARSNRSFS